MQQGWDKRKLLGGAAGIAVVLLGVWGWNRSAASNSDTKSPDTLEFAARGDAPEEGSPEGSPTASPTPASDRLYIHVVGAVKRPGVYVLKPGARIFQAIQAAGGYKENARQDILNAAEFLKDADQIYIPSRSEAPQTGKVTSAPVPPPAARTRTASVSPAPAAPTYGVSPIILPPPVLITGKPVTRRTLVPAPLTMKAETPAPDTRLQGRRLGRPTPDPVTVTEVPPIAGEVATIKTEDTPYDPAASASEAPPASAPPLATASTPSTLRAAVPVRSASSSRTASATTKLKVPGEGMINLNTASLADLERLPGIGPSTAQKILDYRAQKGYITSVEKLQDIKGIGPKTLAKIKPFVTVN
jgi:comEA protein